MNILEDKAEQLQNRVEVLLNDKESPNDLTRTHTENDDEPICTHCGYPAQDLCDLGAHIYEWHAEANWNEVFECSICDMRYPCKKELMSHRKKKHIEIVPICRNFIKGTCHFENCWYKHERNAIETLNFKCGFCGKNFKNKNELMNHVKEKHDLKVKKCNNFMEGTCIFKEKCWYKH